MGTPWLKTSSTGKSQGFVRIAFGRLLDGDGVLGIALVDYVSDRQQQGVRDALALRRT